MHTLLNGSLDNPFGSERGSLEHLLKADYVVTVDYFENLLKSFLFVVVLIRFDGGRTEENV